MSNTGVYLISPETGLLRIQDVKSLVEYLASMYNLPSFSVYSIIDATYPGLLVDVPIRFTRKSLMYSEDKCPYSVNTSFVRDPKTYFLINPNLYGEIEAGFNSEGGGSVSEE